MGEDQRSLSSDADPDDGRRRRGGSVALTGAGARRVDLPDHDRGAGPRSPRTPVSGPGPTARTSPLILPPARLDEELHLDPTDDRETAPRQAEELAVALRDHPGAAAAFEAISNRVSGEPARGDDRPDAARDPADDPADDLDAPDRTRPLAADSDVGHAPAVAEVAATVIAAMRAVGEANERHLAAVEVEAARRYELLTAQAELDAELIRLHARREAHAIIAAARLRAGTPQEPARPDALREIGETFSRFAEAVETTLGLGPTGTGPPRDPHGSL